MQGVFKDVKAPNVYMREVDRSAYDNEQEQSEVDTNVVVCGFAQKGPNLEPRRFIRINDFIATYGYPTNEAERYFYNAADEVLTKGATLLASRLPYDNNAYERVTYCQYEVGTELKKVSDLFPELSEAYPSVVSALEVSPTAKSTGLMDFNLWDSYVTGAAKPSLNSFIIVLRDAMNKMFSVFLFLRKISLYPSGMVNTTCLWGTSIHMTSAFIASCF